MDNQLPHGLPPSRGMLPGRRRHVGRRLAEGGNPTPRLFLRAKRSLTASPGAGLLSTEATGLTASVAGPQGLRRPHVKAEFDVTTRCKGCLQLSTGLVVGEARNSFVRQSAVP